MPSVLHEVLVALFRDAPDLLLELLGDRLDVLSTPGLRFERDEPNLSQLIEIDSDLVFQVFGPDDELRCALILEIQLAIDRDKPRAWAAYQAGSHRRLNCPTFVVVIAIDPAVVDWARGPFFTGQTLFAPIVIGPQHVPIVDDIEVARARLELTLLSGLAHAEQPEALQIGEALWRTIDEANPEYGDLYWDLFLKAVNDATKEALMMRLQHYEPQSDWGKQIFAKGEAKGRLDGEAKGRLDGEAKGRLDGEAKALAVLLDARGLPMTPEHRSRVSACTDQAQLHDWLRQAATAHSLDEVFDVGYTRGDE